MDARKIILLLLSLQLFITTAFAYSDIVITATDKTIVATDVPDNSNLIVGLYKGNKMLANKFYKGADTLVANIVEDFSSQLSDSTTLKAFVWDKDTIMPHTENLSVLLSDLPQSYPTPTIIVNGKQLVFGSEKPFISDSRTLIPLRAVFNALDARVFWYEETKSIIAVKDTNLIELNIGNDTALVNNKKIKLDVPAEIYNSRTYVPLRFVSEALGAKVTFDDSTKTVYIDTTVETQTPPTAAEKFEALTDGDVVFDNSYLSVKNLAGNGSTKTFSDGTATIKIGKEYENPYSSQIVGKIESHSFSKGDIMLCSVKLRAISPTAKIGLTHEESSGDYKKSVSVEYEISKESGWQTVYLPYTVIIDTSEGESQFNIRFGYYAQELELKDFSLVRYNNHKFEDLPAMNTSYRGREADALWRKEAFERIENYRKSDFTISVVDKNANPVKDATINVEMVSHDFDFGTAVRENYINSTPSGHETYKKYLSLFFNSAVTESALKRPSWESNPSNGINVINYLTDIGFKNLRGHTMVWDRWDKLPSHFETDYAIYSPEKMEEETIAHIKDIGTAMRGKLSDWDVANEVIQRHVMIDILGNETLVNWYKAAKEAAPDATLYLNENTVTSINSSNATVFYNMVKQYKQLGAPIEGIGLQCHYSGAINPEDFIKLINYYSDLNCEIKITEFDFQCPDKQLQADFTRDLLIAAYSCPEIKGFYMWGFFDGAHWLNDAPLFNSDWMLKPSGGAYIETVFDTFMTNESGTTGNDGTFSGRGFHGKYKITVSVNGDTYTLNETILNNKNNNFVITIN